MTLGWLWWCCCAWWTKWWLYRRSCRMRLRMGVVLDVLVNEKDVVVVLDVVEEVRTAWSLATPCR